MVLTFKCNFLRRANSTEQTRFTRVFPSGTHLTAESMYVNLHAIIHILNKNASYIDMMPKKTCLANITLTFIQESYIFFEKNVHFYDLLYQGQCRPKTNTFLSLFGVHPTNTFVFIIRRCCLKEVKIVLYSKTVGI